MIPEFQQLQVCSEPKYHKHIMIIHNSYFRLTGFQWWEVLQRINNIIAVWVVLFKFPYK